MRVVHICPTPFGRSGVLGGGERYPLELARALAADVECELVTFGTRPGAIREAGGLTIRTVRSFGRVAGHPAHPLGPGFLSDLRADVIHVHQMRSLPGELAALAARALGSRLAVTDHGLQGSSWWGLLPRLFDRFLTVSKYSASEIGAPPARTRVIYGGVDTARFSPDPSARRSGVLFVGRITPHKGIDRVLAALPAGAKLTIVGSDGHDPHPPESGYPNLLRRLAAGRDVSFRGPVSDDELAALYRTASVVVVPSVNRTCYGRDVRISELLGLAALEAMASGTPVICSDLGGLREVVQDGVNGFLVEPGSAEALRDRLELLLKDGTVAARLSRNAREHVLERFTWRSCAGRCMQAYAEMLSQLAPLT